MLKRKRDKPRKLGLAAKLAGVQPKEATKPKRLGKRAAPRKLGLAARIAAGTQKDTPAKHVNSYRRRKRWPEFMAWIKTKGCVVCSARPCDAAHTEDMPGMSHKGDDRTCIPLCKEHHQAGKDAEHSLPVSFWKIHGLVKETLWAEFNSLYAAIDPAFEPLVEKRPLIVFPPIEP